MTPKEAYALWLEKTAGDREAFEELSAIAGKEEEITDRFYRELSFGTAGLRGIMGMGTNRMNRYTVERATRGLAAYIKHASQSPSAAIAYDSRRCSEEFARRAACVFAAHGVRALLYQKLMPTPALSYAVRELGCDAGVVITASHNPAAYNGYKVYGPDGCQIGPEQAEAVGELILAADLFGEGCAADFDEALAAGMIRWIPEEFVEKYLNRVYREALEPDVCERAGLSVVYTPLNGAGTECVPAIFERIKVKNVILVPQQEHPDGDFPTCPYPNPETREALALGLALCEKTGADLLVATDPDCDRLGLAVRHEGRYRILTGNEVGILMMDYICGTRTRLNTMPERPVAVRSVVSSQMADLVAAGYGVECRVVLTGFKFVGEVIAGLEQDGGAQRFLFAYEESCGYLAGSYVRDKDAVNSSMLAVEMASAHKLEGRTLVDALDALYQRLGIWRSAVDNFAFEGAKGMARMTRIMEGLRKAPPRELGGERVRAALDYQSGTDLLSGERQPLPKANMIEMRLEGGGSVIVRPSGTEPKIKVYYTVTGSDHAAAEESARRLKEACAPIILPGD